MTSVSKEIATRAEGCLGSYRGYKDNGKENGNYRDYRDYIGFIKGL